MTKKRKLDSSSNSITFHYQNSKYLRTIKVDGAWGGLSPRSEIQMSVYSDLIPSPSFREFEIKEDGKLGKQKRGQFSKQGIIREVEATLIMTPEVAEAVAKWLLMKVEEYKSIIEEDIEENVSEQSSAIEIIEEEV